MSDKRLADVEKLSVNVGVVDVGKIDVLVEEGLYAGRTDFIRAAVRAQLDRHHVEMQHTIQRHAFVVGALAYDKAALERAKARGEHLDIMVIGILSLGSDVTPGLAADVIRSVKVRGAFRASAEVKLALADRTI